jgi:RNA 2',3'-cyclic 3'-phosphodiesterase
MRLFVGIPLTAEMVEELSRISIGLRGHGDRLRWTAPESWHVTLQFLGSVDEQRYACVVARLREVRSAPVPVRLEDLGCFERAGVFFAGVGLTPELVSLQQRVTAATKLCGFVPESRPYHPHITLARSKDGAKGLRELKAKLRRRPGRTGFVAEAFVLYESVPGATGSRYEIRERFALDGSRG